MNADVKRHSSTVQRLLRQSVATLTVKTSLKLKHLCLSQTQAVLPQRPLKHTLTHWTKISNFVSHELYLKRLIVGGFDKVYEIGRVFRNEGLDTRHNPEFTLMELYQAYTDYNGMMDLTENLYRHVVAKEVLLTTIVYNGIEMDLGKPFERITMVDAVKKYAGVDFNEINTLEEARKVADEHHVEYEERHKKGDILNLFFEEFVENI